MLTLTSFFRLAVLIVTIQQSRTAEDKYLRYVKDGCFLQGEALSCVKYKALKIAKKTIFGDMKFNETITANHAISFVPLDEDTVKQLTVAEEKDLLPNESKSFLSEWTELAKYFMSLVKEFFKMRGLRVNLPEGARTVEEQDSDDGRGRKKKLAIVIPLLTLLATMKTKFLLIPILLSVLLIKKLLLIAALLLPGLLSTLKACKMRMWHPVPPVEDQANLCSLYTMLNNSRRYCVRSILLESLISVPSSLIPTVLMLLHHHPMTHYSYFGSDSSDFNSDYSNSYMYSSGGGYGKDWPSNRAYTLPKARPSPAPVYITAPGAAV